VDNRAGGSTNIGAEFVARAAPDGYTLFMASSTQVINATLYPKLNYDLARDFTPVSPVASSPAMLVVGPKVPARNVRELVALIRSQPGKITFASGGVGSTGHLAGELFRMSEPGLNVIHVPYKGSAPAITDLLSGHVQYLFGFTDVPPFVKSGKLRALAVTSAKRLGDFPDVPTMEEAGTKDLVVTVWFGVLAPAGTPAEIVDLLNTHIAKAVDELAPRLHDLSSYPLRSSPAEFAAFVEQDIARWKPAVERSGAKVQ
ncbi:MAG: tripartite tricarboxylate transporter substrate-binding protein, partial [Burkholderiaceae bacterium]